MEIIGPHHPLRQAAESLVRTIYAKQYGAIPREFPEMLVALLNKQDQPVCVAGVRFGEDGYFSETDPWICAMPDSIAKPLAFFDRGLGHSQAVGKEAVEIVHG